MIASLRYLSEKVLIWTPIPAQAGSVSSRTGLLPSQEHKLAFEILPGHVRISSTLLHHQRRARWRSVVAAGIRRDGRYVRWVRSLSTSFWTAQEAHFVGLHWMISGRRARGEKMNRTCWPRHDRDEALDIGAGASGLHASRAEEKDRNPSFPSGDCCTSRARGRVRQLAMPLSKSPDMDDAAKLSAA